MGIGSGAVGLDGGGGAAKDVAADARGALLALSRFLGLEGPSLPGRPGLGSGSEAVPVEAELGETSSGEEGHGGDGCEPFVGDGELGP